MATISVQGRLSGLLAAFLLLSACGEGGGAPSAVPPLAVARITSPFGMRDHHPIHRDSGPSHHDGYDLAAPKGSPIFAARDGKVVFAGNRGGYGLTVDLDHAGGVSTRYAHASRLTVRQGQKVQAGEILGFVGSTGLSTGPHLHYEVRVGRKAVDPRHAGFALAADIRTGRPAKARLASFERIEAARRDRVRPASVPAPKVAATRKIRPKRADKPRTVQRIAEIRLKHNPATRTN